MTIYMYETEESNILGRHNRRGTSSQGSSRLPRPILGMLIMLAAQTIFVAFLVTIVFVAVTLSD